MKEKLAPIHFVQYQRIHLQEQMESFLAEKFQLEDKLAELETLYGVRSAEVNLSEQIDHDNIHGWLEGHLIANEKRLSQLIAEILKQNDPSTLHHTYEEFGENLGKSVQHTVSISNGQELYQFLQSVILDGMPCDKVNQLMGSDDQQLVFSSTKDVHAPYYSDAGLDPALYHELRSHFMAGLLHTLDSGKYSYTVENGAILHKVVL